jgi:hypothetical protein
MRSDQGIPRKGRNRLAGSAVSRRLLGGGLGAVVVAAAVVTIVVLPGGQTQPPARARIYTAFSACLLTDAHGLAGSPAKEAWAGMERASLATHARVSFLAVAGAATRGNAVPYLATLVMRRCNVIVATGAVQAAAVALDAGRFGSVRFVTIGGHSTQPNVVDANVPAGQLGSEIDGLVESAARSAAG